MGRQVSFSLLISGLRIWALEGMKDECKIYDTALCAVTNICSRLKRKSEGSGHRNVWIGQKNSCFLVSESVHTGRIFMKNQEKILEVLWCDSLKKHNWYYPPICYHRGVDLFNFFDLVCNAHATKKNCYTTERGSRATVHIRGRVNNGRARSGWIYLVAWWK